MENTKSDTLAERIERLERENYRWKCGAGLALVASLVAIVGGAQRANEAKVVEAEQFIVRDREGKERVRLGLASNGDPALFIRGKDGQNRVILQSNDESVGGLYLSGRDGTLSVVLEAAARASNTPLLVLSRDKRRINLNVNTIPRLPWLTLQDEDDTLFQVPEPTAKKIAVGLKSDATPLYAHRRPRASRSCDQWTCARGCEYHPPRSRAWRQYGRQSDCPLAPHSCCPLDAALSARKQGAE